jgi:hypothetical protein
MQEKIVKKKLTEMQLSNELVRTGEVDKVNFTTVLQDLFEKKIIDKESFKRMGKLLENYLDESKEEQKNKLDEIYL